jgi:hypothetical protein
MRGFFAAFVLAVALVGSTLSGVSSASAQFRISEDRGGQIGPYLQQFAMVRDSGSRVVIDGTCLSACTLVLGTVPKDRICVTSRANLGFHAAWNLAQGGHAVYSDEGTRLLWEIYPTQIRNWIKRKGGLTPRMIFLKGKELASMYATCPSSAHYAEARSQPGQGRADGVTLAAATH